MHFAILLWLKIMDIVVLLFSDELNRINHSIYNIIYLLNQMTRIAIFDMLLNQNWKLVPL